VYDIPSADQAAVGQHTTQPGYRMLNNMFTVDPDETMNSDNGVVPIGLPCTRAANQGQLSQVYPGLEISQHNSQTAYGSGIASQVMYPECFTTPALNQDPSNPNQTEKGSVSALASMTVHDNSIAHMSEEPSSSRHSIPVQHRKKCRKPRSKKSEQKNKRRTIHCVCGLGSISNVADNCRIRHPNPTSVIHALCYQLQIYAEPDRSDLKLVCQGCPGGKHTFQKRATQRIVTLDEENDTLSCPNVKKHNAYWESMPVQSAGRQEPLSTVGDWTPTTESHNLVSTLSVDTYMPTYTLGNTTSKAAENEVVSRNHIERRLSSAIIVDAEPNEQYNADSETRGRETMVRSTLSNFADFAFV
jgi:hypothetical protein